MTSDQKPAPSAGGLTLYAHLVGSAGAGTQITSAPVMYNQNNETQEQTSEATTAKPNTDFTKQLFQQRSKRPQQTKGNRGPRPPVFPASASSQTASSSSPDKSSAQASAAPSVGPVTTTSAADWMSREEDDLEYLEAEKYNRFSRKPNKKKKKNKQDYVAEIDWDEPYDPSQPTNYDLYQDSEEFRDAENEWFNKLHAHSFARRGRSTEEEEEEPATQTHVQRNRMFAPPIENNGPIQSTEDIVMADDTQPRPSRFSGMAAMPAEEDEDEYTPTMNLGGLTDQSGDDVWARRAAMSGVSFAPPSQSTALPNPTTSQPSHETPPSPAHVISRAPVRFEAAASSANKAPDDDGEDIHMTMEEEKTGDVEDDEEAPRSNRPGQAGFAKRLLMKHGWKEGQGLGASGTGMVKPLYVKLDKPKKFSDAEGGGFRKGGTGKIIAGKKAKGVIEDEGQYGKMSEVVVILGLLRGVDIETEMQADIPLFQRIGDECNQRFGNVEKVTANEETGRIFIKFTQSLSALRAVQALDGGSLQSLDLINAPGSIAVTRYYDPDNYGKQILDAPVRGEEASAPEAAE